MNDLYKSLGKGRKNDEHAHSIFKSGLFPGYEESLIISTRCRILYLSEDITPQSANQLSAILLYLDTISHEPITLNINSRGGSASGLGHVIDVMGMIESPVRTVNIGRAYSAGSVILAAGDERFAFKHSKAMIHGLQATFPIPDDQKNNKLYYDFLHKYNDGIIRVLAEHTGHPFAKVKEDCKADVYMDANEMLEYGLVDEVIW